MWTNGIRGGRAGIALLALCSIALRPGTARAGSLANVFNSGALAGLQLEPIGPALAGSVASTYPVASASSSVTYAFNPQSETFERHTRVLGPIIGERAETIGKGQFDITVSYSSIDFSTINGQSLGDLVNQPSINGRVVSFPVPDGVTLADGRFANFLPVLVHANIDVEADIYTPSVTYGVTPDLDVNLGLPIINTFLGVRIQEDVPDPRLPQFQLRSCDPNLPPGNPDRCAPGEIRPTRLDRSAFERSTGVGDLLLRAKYVFVRDVPVNLAAGLGVSFPTGNEDNFQGTGTYRVQPTFIVSRVIADRVEPLLNLGFDLNADDVDRSVARWAVGAVAQIAGPLTGAVMFLGRHELSAQSDQIEAPFFFQIERNDFYDVSLGLRLLFAESGVVSVNAILPLNDAGLRADVIPSVEVEYAFDPGW